MVTDSDRLWPCESAHNITVSLDRVKSITVCLPHPILPKSIKAALQRKAGIVEVVAVKALPTDLWPDDVVDERFRWNPDQLEPCRMDHATIMLHTYSQLPISFFKLQTSDSLKLSGRYKDALAGVREFIGKIFDARTEEGIANFTAVLQNREEFPLIYLQIHSPVLTSPQGTPILLVSVLDHIQSVQLRHEGHVNQKEPNTGEIFREGNPTGKGMVLKSYSLNTLEEIYLLRSILRLNSTKIQPTTWQEENLPLNEPTPWLATFIRPLNRYGFSHSEQFEYCANCNEDTSDEPKRCGRCKAVIYCSVECQRADWPKHKPSCHKV